MSMIPPPPEPAAPPVAPTVAAGWYADVHNPGLNRWWDGTQWTEHRNPIQPATAAPQGRTANGMGVSYVRTQTGHSLLKNLLWGTFILWINVIYISVSPNHYWHA